MATSDSVGMPTPDSRTLDTVLGTDTTWLCAFRRLSRRVLLFHKHTTLSLRIVPKTPRPSHRQAVPSLRDHAPILDFDALDPIEHDHISYVVILVRVLEECENCHGGQSRKTHTEWQKFKKLIPAMRIKVQTLTKPKPKRTVVGQRPSPPSESLSVLPSPRRAQGVHRPIRDSTSTLPDMKSDTSNHIHLQRVYKTRGEEEKQAFKNHLRAPSSSTCSSRTHTRCRYSGTNGGALSIGTRLGWALVTSPKETSTHLALSALSALEGNGAGSPPTVELLRREVQSIVSYGVELPEELDHAIGEL
ncbi:hypothetical protein HD554DRAFT_2037150 [Boletus coccyginus]|nr:hypothetical protein HD554DRAFT_2037150 [Boletus coccyginus]